MGVSGSATALDFLAGHAAVRLEDARRRELAELVPDHVLRDVNRDVRLAVVDTDGVADELGRDGGTTGPGLDRLAGAAGLGRLLDFLQEVVVDKETFLDGTCHGAGSLNYFLLRGGRPFLRMRMKLLESLERRRVGKPFASWPHGETRCWRP